MYTDQIRKYYDHLSRSYRRVADFILTDYQTAAFMTAAALAQAVDVDTTTVVRFAQRLGYPGYPELIDDIQQQVRAELGQTYVAAEAEDTLPARVQHRVAQDRAHLDKTMAHNPLPTIEKVLDLLEGAPRIVVLGESYAAPLAESFALMLKEAGLPAVYVGGDVYDRASALSQLARKEVVIGVSPLSESSGVARALQYARNEGVVTLACTPGLNSQVSRSADHLLYAPGEESQSGMTGLTGLYSLLTALALSLADRDPEAVAHRRNMANQALEEMI